MVLRTLGYPFLFFVGLSIQWSNFSYTKAWVTRWSFWHPYVMRPTELLTVIIQKNLPLYNENKEAFSNQ